MKKFFLIQLLYLATFLFSQYIDIQNITNPDAVIEKDFYIPQYNEKFEQADWVAYELTKMKFYVLLRGRIQLNQIHQYQQVLQPWKTINPLGMIEDI